MTPLADNETRPFALIALMAALLFAPVAAQAQQADGDTAPVESAPKSSEDVAQNASGDASGDAAQEAPTVVYEKKTVLDFSDVTLEGELSRPEGSYLINRKRARFGSLVQLRGDFIPELQQSIDNL